MGRLSGTLRRALKWVLRRVHPRIRNGLEMAVIRRHMLRAFPDPYAETVSIVVPYYNVGRYIAACLESIRRQEYINFEVILVDDGSLDDSQAIADQYVRRDPRFKLIAQQNAGLGAARNAGLAHVTGRYVIFVDSDDELLPDALSRMVSSLQATGSDFVVAGFDHLSGDSRWQDAWVQSAHREDRHAIVVDDLPEITKNVFAWSKLYVTDFFLDHIGGYPEGLLNEDQEPAAKGYARSGQFDVLSATTYLWRSRDDGSSITQNRHTMRNLEDRIRAETEVTKHYLEHSSAAVQLFRWRDFVGDDFSQFYRYAYEGSDEYWAKTSEYIANLFVTLPSVVWRGVAVRERCLAYAVSTGDRKLAETMVSVQRKWPKGVPVVHDGTDVIVDVEQWGFDRRTWPRDLLVLQEVDTPLRTGVTRLVGQTDGSLLVEGYCFVEGYVTDQRGFEITLDLVSEFLRPQRLDVERFSFDLDDLEIPGNSFAKYPDTGFRVRIKASQISKLGHAAELKAHVSGHNVKRCGPLAVQDVEHSPYLRPIWDQDGIGLLVNGDTFSGLRFKSLEPPVRLLSAEIGPQRNATLRIASSVVFGPDASLDLVDRFDPGLVTPVASIVTEGGNRVTAITFEVPNLAQYLQRFEDRHWRLQISDGDRNFPLLYPETSDIDSCSQPFRADWDGDSGEFILVSAPWSLSARLKDCVGTKLWIAGNIASAPGYEPRLAFMSPQGIVKDPSAINVDGHDGGFEAAFEFDESDFSIGRGLSEPIYGLCLVEPKSLEIFRSARSAQRLPTNENGLRSLAAGESISVEVTDFGYRRSLLVRRHTKTRSCD